MIASMTGYARAQGADDRRRWVWEARSVNGRNLEIRCRVPQGFERLENPARTAVGGRLKRGNVSLTLTLTSERQSSPLRINRALLTELATLVEEVRKSTGAAAPSADGLLRVRGVIEEEEEDGQTEEQLAILDKALTATLDEVLQALVAALGRLLRRPLGALLTTLVIAVALALPAGLWLLVQNARAATGDLATAVQVSAFLKVGTSVERAQELAIAVAGPAVNVALALLFGAILVTTQGVRSLEALGVLLLPSQGLTFPGILAQLVEINVGLILFNLLPAFPMDGGRVLRALLALRSGDLARATRRAAQVGRVFAALFAFVGLFVWNNPSLVLIAVFVWLAGAGEAASRRPF